MNELQTQAEGTQFLSYTLQVNASPYGSEAADLAYGFACALLAKGHRLRRVFFYQEGVYHALAGAMPPADEAQRIARWSELARSHQVDLVICSAAAQRRGVWNPEEKKELAPGFRVAGLALLVESILESDRLLMFG